MCEGLQPEKLFEFILPKTSKNTPLQYMKELAFIFNLMKNHAVFSSKLDNIVKFKQIFFSMGH